MQDIAPSILKSLKPSIEETIARSIETSMMSCLNMAVETVLRKFKEDVMDPQIEQKNGEIKTLRNEISLRDQQIESLQETVTELRV